jgi:hypothetical protein
MNEIIFKVKSKDELDRLEKALLNLPESVKKGIFSAEINLVNDYVLHCRQNGGKLNVISTIDRMDITKTSIKFDCRCYIFIFDVKEDSVKHEVSFHSPLNQR